MVQFITRQLYPHQFERASKPVARRVRTYAVEVIDCSVSGGAGAARPTRNTLLSTIFQVGNGVYGYRWFVGEILDRPVYTHADVLSGYTSSILYFPDARLTIIVLRNYGLDLYDRLEIELATIVFKEH